MAEMNDDQRTAFSYIKDGESIFITGPAGTGKTFLITHVIKWAEENQKNIAVTAMTGAAAVLLPYGRTLHSYLGIFLGDKTVPEMVKYTMKKQRHIVTRLKSVNIIIIDEVSMLSKELFEKIIPYVDAIRDGKPPVQYIFVGDFHQLQPVDGKQCCTSELWDKIVTKTVVLSKLVRQANDERFQELLMRLRHCRATDDDYNILKGLKDTVFTEGIEPTVLYSRNVNVDAINHSAMNKLITEQKAATHTYNIQFSNKEAEKWYHSFNRYIPEKVQICIGSQIMLTWNIDISAGLVNGTRGVVTCFSDNDVYVTFCNGVKWRIEYHLVVHPDNKKIYIKVMPIKLAHAITIHKSQGMTLDAIEMDLGPTIFAKEMVYVALSRAKSLNSIRIIDICRDSIMFDKTA